ncbi:MAG: hypothetical protein KF819_04455 [Labilithrix sp.]|nr:hypothetical protein [Labilithrix sp.]
MFETAGALTIVEQVSSLVWLVALPLLWAVVSALVSLRGGRGATGQRIAAQVSIAAAGGAFGLAVSHAVRAAMTPAGRVAQQHVAQFVRIGQLEVGIDLVRDPTSATLALLVTFIAFLAVLHAVWSVPGHVSGRLAWTGLLTSGVLLVVLGDDWPLVAVGLQLATLAAWGLGGGGRKRSLAVALGGDAAVLYAAWVLFWSLGGGFGASGYTPDPLPRFAIVSTPEPAPEGKSTVSLTTYEDALVTSDDGPPLPGEPLHSPFALTLEPGTYSFRLQAGAATSDLLVTHVTLAPGRSYVLTPYGPTTSMRNLGDQLAVARPTSTGPSPLRAVLAQRTIGGVPVAAVIGFIVVLGALLRLSLLARGDRGGLAYTLEGVPPLILAMRVTPLLEPGSLAGAALAIAPVIAAVVLAAKAASSGLGRAPAVAQEVPGDSRDGVPRTVVAALSALAVASVFLGEPASAIVIVVAASLGAAAVTAAIDSDADVRWLGVACAGLAGLMPAAGASPGIASVTAGAFAASAAGRVAGAIIAPVVTLSAVLVSLAVFRVYGASIRAPAKVKGPRGPRVLVVLLAVASLGAGVALGVGTSPFGGSIPPLARRLVLGRGGLDGGPRMVAAAFGISLAAAALGLLAARRATSTARRPRWIAALAAPTALFGYVAAAGASVVRFLARSVDTMDREMIDDATELLTSGAVAASGGLRRLERIPARLVGKPKSDAPTSNRFELFRLALVLAMVALLGLVVLSSMLLG